MKIQAAIFDIGNVLVPFDYERAFRKLEALSPANSPVDRAAVFAAREELEIGRSSRAEFVARARALFGHQGPEEEFVRIWEDIFDENPPMNAVVASLARRLPLYLLSNTNCIHREYLQRAFPVFSHFQRGIYSYEAGMLKPDPALFEFTVRALGVEPERTLYIDDMPENAAAARRSGFQVVEYNHRDHDRALAEIAEIAGFSVP
ncbi:MAG: HAD family phosphatase [Terrimicrobiaceae bacterium]|nr:HAD family phosphatase [Terrimicrobiaceae bacterium]